MFDGNVNSFYHDQPDLGSDGIDLDSCAIGMGGLCSENHVQSLATILVDPGNALDGTCAHYRYGTSSGILVVGYLWHSYSAQGLHVVGFVSFFS